MDIDYIDGHWLHWWTVITVMDIDYTDCSDYGDDIDYSYCGDDNGCTDGYGIALVKYPLFSRKNHPVQEWIIAVFLRKRSR